MNCKQWEEQIALLAESDLPATEAREVENHIAACQACEQFFCELRETQSLLHTLGHDELPEAALAQVRENVMREAAAGRKTKLLPFPTTWKWAAAVAAAAAVLVCAIWLTQQPETIPPPRQTISKAAPAATAPAGRAQSEEARGASDGLPQPLTEAPPSEAAPSEHAEHARIASDGSPQSHPAPTTIPPASLDATQNANAGQRPTQPDNVVKLFTDDPNVVIYWILETEGTD